MPNDLLTTVLLGLAVLGVGVGLGSVAHGLLFVRFVRRSLRRPVPDYTPRATVLLPCKGVDDRLVDTLRAVTRFDYPGYEVICAVEAADDPAVAVIERIARETGYPLRCVVAGLAEGHSQKIENLLAAIGRADPSSEIYAFLDSDAVPDIHWLRQMVGPLSEPSVGAVTGYRWYVPLGTFVSLVRTVWNSVLLALLGNHRFNYCWGGSIAIRVTTFERLRIAERWQRVLSEDYEITRTMQSAGLRIVFATRCVVPNAESTNWREFWLFVRRQFIITRRCHTPAWTIGALLTLVLALGFWGALALGIVALSRGQSADARLAWGLWTALAGLSATKGLLRYTAIKSLVPANQRRGVLWTEVLAGPIVLTFNTLMIVASGVSDRFWWRGIRYEMSAVDRTRVLARTSTVPSTAPSLPTDVVSEPTLPESTPA